MTRRPVQALFLAATTLLGTAALLSPREVPPIVAISLAVAAACGVAVVLLDSLLQSWLEANWGKGTPPTDFLRQDALPITARLAVATTIGAALVAGRGFLVVEPTGPAAAVALAGALTALLLTVAQAITRRLGSAARRSTADPLWAAGRYPGFTAEARAAVQFSQIAGGRIAWDLIRLGVITALGLAVVAALALGTGAVATRVHEGVWWPVAFHPARGILHQLVAALAAGGTGLVLVTSLLAALHEVDTARQTGRPPSTPVVQLFGDALDRGGIPELIGWGAINGGVIFLFAQAAFGRLAPALAREGFPATQADAAALASLAIAFVAFALVQLHAPGILRRRDCGLVTAIHAGLTIAARDGWSQLPRLALVLLWGLSLVRLPAALHLLLTPLDGREELLATLLGEKSVREARGALEQRRADAPEAVRRAYQLLEKGQHLQALNGFQLYLHRNRGDLDAMRGQCLAMLALGHTVAVKDKLAVWQTLDPGNPEPTRLLEEIAAGKW